MFAEMEQRFEARIITFEDNGVLKAGGQCRLCGAGPNIKPDYQSEPRYIYQAGLCDSDGVYYGACCEDCLEDLPFENAQRVKNERDQIAEQITELLGDDIDGMQTMMDDMQ